MIAFDRKFFPKRYTFEQVEKSLYKHAKFLSKIFGGKYEVDELVNETWANMSWQKCKKPEYLSKRIYRDMLDYIRKIEGRSIQINLVLVERPKTLTNKHENVRWRPDQKTDFFADQLYRGMDHEDEVDMMDQLNHLFSCLSKKEFKLLKQYYVEELTLKQIGQIEGLSECHISGLRKRLLEKIREEGYITTDRRMTDVQKNKKKPYDDSSLTNRCKPQIEPMAHNILPEYVSDFEIDNKYATEEDFILERDWEQ